MSTATEPLVERADAAATDAQLPDTQLPDTTADEGAAGPTNAEVGAADASVVFHSWSKQGGLKPLPLAGGQGTTVWDHDGNRYLDFSGQLVFTNMGHQHPKIIAGITEQLSKLTTVAPAHGNATRAEAARLILQRAPEGFEKVFFTNGGADANENAIRMARLVTGRSKVALALPLLPRQHRRGDRRDRRLAPHPQRVRDRARPLLRAVPLPQRVLGQHRGGGGRPRAAPPRARGPGRGPGEHRRDPARDHPRHRRDHGPAGRLPLRRPCASPTATGSS